MERRRAARRAPAADEPLSRVRLRAGRELQVVDLSNSGALVEGATRLLPGTHVDVHLVTSDGRTLMRSRVVRAWVSLVEPDAVRYRGALAFDRSVDTGMTFPADEADLLQARGPFTLREPDAVTLLSSP